MQNNKYEFDRTQTYKLIGVTDKNGNDKSHEHSIYQNNLNCIATDLHFDDEPYPGDFYRMRMTFVQTEKGMWCKRSLHTSLVNLVDETENGINVHTSNTTYIFEKASLKDVPFRDESHLIELYLDADSDYSFCKGIYYDKNKKPHMLRESVHLGTFQDSVLVGFEQNDIPNNLFGWVCRYFPIGNTVEFYNAIAVQQDCGTPILIHNTGKTKLTVKHQLYSKSWVIEQGANMYFEPFKKLDRK